MNRDNGFKLKYDEFRSQHLYRDHFHNSHEIVYIIEGAAKFTISGRDYQADGPSMLFINNLEPHKSTVLKYPYRRYYILISQPFLRMHVQDPLLLSVLTQRPDQFNHMIRLDNIAQQKTRKFFSAMHEEYTYNDKYSDDAIGSLVKIMLINLYRDYPGHFPTGTDSSALQLINRITHHIENHYMDDITLKSTASDNNMDMYYLSRLFKQVTGFGFKEYLISQRLSRAKEMLLSSNDSITEICINCGYNNVNHFIRIFKEKEGITPLRFRRKNILDVNPPGPL